MPIIQSSREWAAIITEREREEGSQVSFAKSCREPTSSVLLLVLLFVRETLLKTASAHQRDIEAHSVRYGACETSTHTCT